MLSGSLHSQERRQESLGDTRRTKRMASQNYERARMIVELYHIKSTDRH